MSIPDEARKFLQALRESSEYESLKHADKILLFLYKLQDDYIVVASNSPRFVRGPIISLRDLIYQLESKPDEMFRSDEGKDFLMLILEDMALRRVEVALRERPED